VVGNWVFGKQCIHPSQFAIAQRAYSPYRETSDGQLDVPVARNAESIVKKAQLANMPVSKVLDQWSSLAEFVESCARKSCIQLFLYQSYAGKDLELLIVHYVLPMDIPSGLLDNSSWNFSASITAR